MKTLGLTHALVPEYMVAKSKNGGKKTGIAETSESTRPTSSGQL